MVKNLPFNERAVGLIPATGRSYMLQEQLSPCATAVRPSPGTHQAVNSEVHTPRACAPQEEKPPQSACTPVAERVAPTLHN